jgi:hypothetical protein
LQARRNADACVPAADDHDAVVFTGRL